MRVLVINGPNLNLSDIARGEEWCARSVVSPACAATISGHGADG